MKLNKLFLVLALALNFSAFSKSESKDKSVKSVDATKSTLKWTGEKVGGEHWGYIKFSKGSIEYNKKGEPKSAEFVVNMESMSVDDIQGEYATKLLGHLKNDDFFSVDKYKTSTLKIDKFKKGKKPGIYTASGKLTIKDKTQDIKFDVKNKADGFGGTLVFDRTKFEIKYNSGSFFESIGDKMIYDDVKLDFNLALK